MSGDSLFFVAKPLRMITSSEGEGRIKDRPVNQVLHSLTSHFLHYDKQREQMEPESIYLTPILYKHQSWTRHKVVNNSAWGREWLKPWGRTVALKFLNWPLAPTPPWHLYIPHAFDRFDCFTAKISQEKVIKLKDLITKKHYTKFKSMDLWIQVLLFKSFSSMSVVGV